MYVLKKRVRVKVCCIKSKEEARLAIAAGVDALGLVSAMPSGPGMIPEDQITEIAAIVSPPISTFLLTSQTDAATIIQQQSVCRTNVLQLVDHVGPMEHKKLKHTLPGIGIVQVVHVIDESSIEQAITYSNTADAILLDSGNPNLEIKEFGGTGRTHNWGLSREIVKQVSVPVFLAGGLNPANTAAAIKEVKPFGLDICSGLRTDGRLDGAKLSAFMEQAASFGA